MTTLREIPKLPAKLHSAKFTDHMYEHYQWMHEQAPICRGKVSVIDVVLVAPYEECRALLTDRRFLRDRAAATGGRAYPVPLPRSLQLMTEGMITQDDPAHRRQRSLVAKAFTPSLFTYSLGQAPSMIKATLIDHRKVRDAYLETADSVVSQAHKLSSEGDIVVSVERAIGDLARIMGETGVIAVGMFSTNRLRKMFKGHDVDADITNLSMSPEGNVTSQRWGT